MINSALSRRPVAVFLPIMQAPQVNISEYTLDSMPEDMIEETLNFSKLDTVINFSFTCKKFHRIAGKTFEQLLKLDPFYRCALSPKEFYFAGLHNGILFPSFWHLKMLQKYPQQYYIYQLLNKPSDDLVNASRISISKIKNDSAAFEANVRAIYQ